jgi:ribulose 1,5-bisphosphate synthetase/thiazole synthase
MTLPIPNKTDIVVVGSSPYGLLEALQHRFEGREVLLLEKSEVLGGAWGGETACGIPNVDIGAHDFVLDKENGEFLRRKFQVELTDVSRRTCSSGASDSTPVSARAVRKTSSLQARGCLAHRRFSVSSWGP